MTPTPTSTSASAAQPPPFSLSDPPSLAVLIGRESETNWEARDRLLDVLMRFCISEANAAGSVSDSSNFSGSFSSLSLPASDPRLFLANYLKINYEDILLVLHTPRTQLAIRACNFIGAFAHFLGSQLFDPFAEATLHHLLKLCGTTKKLIANAAAEALRIVGALMSPQRAANSLVQAGQDKNVSIRLKAFECVRVLLERAAWSPNDELQASAASLTGSSSSLSLSPHHRLWDTIAEKILARGIGDANAEIRACAVAVFSYFKDRIPDTAQAFMDRLDAGTKKQLNLILAKSAPPKPPIAVLQPSPYKPLSVATSLKDEGSKTAALGLESRSRTPSPLKKSASSMTTAAGMRSPTQRQAPESKASLAETKTSPKPLGSRHQKSPIKAAAVSANVQSTDSLRSVQLAKRNRAISASAPDIPLGPISVAVGSPMKVDATGDNRPLAQSPSATDVFYDAIESSEEDPRSQTDRQSLRAAPSPALVSDDYTEVTLNAKIRAAQQSSRQGIDELTAQLPQKIHLAAADAATATSASAPNTPTIRHCAEQLTLPGSPASSPRRTPTRNTFMLSPPQRHSAGSLSNTRTADSVFSESPSRLPLKIKALGLVASTPLRRLYRHTGSDSAVGESMAMASTHENAHVASASSTTSLIAVLAERITAAESLDDQAIALRKLGVLVTKLQSPEHVDVGAVAAVFAAAYPRGELRPGLVELGERLLALEPLLLQPMLPALVQVLEAEEANERAERLALALAQSVLNQQLGWSLSELLCRDGLSVHRLSLLALCIRSCPAPAAFLDSQLLPVLIPPLLLALNHPLAEFRRLAIGCFAEASKRIGREAVLGALQTAGAANVHVRFVDSFLRRFQ